MNLNEPSCGFHFDAIPAKKISLSFPSTQPASLRQEIADCEMTDTPIQQENYSESFPSQSTCFESAFEVNKQA